MKGYCVKLNILFKVADRANNNIMYDRKWNNFIEAYALNVIHLYTVEYVQSNRIDKIIILTY